MFDREPKAALFIKRKLKRWQTDPDLISVRDLFALARLSAEEQADWRQLWADVQKLLARLETTKQ